MDKEKRIRKWLDDNVTDAPEGLAQKVQARIDSRRATGGRTRAWRWAFAGAVLTILTVTLALWVPRYALANALKQVHAAIIDAKTMRQDLYIGTGSKRWLFTRAWYQQGDWRHQVWLGTPRERTFLLLPTKNEYWVCYPTLKMATVQPYDRLSIGMDVKGEVDAIEYVKQITDLGPSNVAREVHIEPGQPVEGRPTFKIVAARDNGRSEDGNVHSEILVDSETKLPLRATFDQMTPAGGGRPSGRTEGLYEFTFNEVPDAKLFTPEFGEGTKIVDLPREWARFRRQWSKPLYKAEIEGEVVEVHDVEVGALGDVFLIYSVPGDFAIIPGDPAPAPISVSDGTPQVYVRGMYEERPQINSLDFDADNLLGRPGRTVRVAHWVPLEPLAKPRTAGTLEFRFGRYVFRWEGGAGCADPTFAAKPAWRHRFAKAYADVLPDLLVTLGLAMSHVTPELNAASLRGSYYADVLRDNAKALKWYRRANEIATATSPRGGSSFRVKEMIECLQALGRKAEANELRKRYKMK